jgi:hypothetical protein
MKAYHLPAAVILLFMSAVPAMSCTCPPATIASAFSVADVVIEGTVTKFSPLPQSKENEQLIRVRITRAWKGANAGTTFTLVTPQDDTSCGIKAPTGTHRIFFAQQQSDSVLPLARACPSFLENADVASELNKLGK